ncbi:hypothetical protein C4K34_6172 [Pseudomonas chlororaphis subsp. piscium]|nr:hypothetical protein C4K34_6172 [Pseudomonas chlororaphis subsp. piscium]
MQRIPIKGAGSRENIPAAAAFGACARGKGPPDGYSSA